jgi:hypothetical protein
MYAFHPLSGSAGGDCLIPQYLWDYYEPQEICMKKMAKPLVEFKFCHLGKKFYETK